MNIFSWDNPTEGHGHIPCFGLIACLVAYLFACCLTKHCFRLVSACHVLCCDNSSVTPILGRCLPLCQQQLSESDYLSASCKRGKKLTACFGFLQPPNGLFLSTLLVVLPLESLAHGLFHELGSCLGGTCAGYALVIPTSYCRYEPFELFLQRIQSRNLSLDRQDLAINK